MIKLILNRYKVCYHRKFNINSVALIQIKSKTEPFHAFYINFSPYSILANHKQFIWLLIPHILIEEAVLVLLLGIVKILLHIRDICQYLIYGASDAEEDFLTHSFDCVLVVECDVPGEGVIRPAISIKFLFRNVNKINIHDLIFHKPIDLIGISGQFLPPRKIQ